MCSCGGQLAAWVYMRQWCHTFLTSAEEGLPLVGSVPSPGTLLSFHTMPGRHSHNAGREGRGGGGVINNGVWGSKERYTS